MAVFELYSTRNKAKYPEVYQYGDASDRLRNQLAQILIATIGDRTGSYTASPSEEVYQYLFDVLSREYGVSAFGRHSKGSYVWLRDYIENHTDTDELLDVLELACGVIDVHVLQSAGNFAQNDNVRQKPDDALAEINERMKRDGFGFEYTDGILVRIDSQYVHAEAVKPALLILQGYEAPQQEFLAAHEHYRHGKYKECLMNCGRAFEGMMKIICDAEGWTYNPKKAGASNLIAVCSNNGLFKAHSQEHLNGLTKTLESGVPPIRNDNAGHAKPEPIVVSEHLVKYTLHLTAVNLVFLDDCYKDLNDR